MKDTASGKRLASIAAADRGRDLGERFTMRNRRQQDSLFVWNGALARGRESRPGLILTGPDGAWASRQGRVSTVGC